MLDDIKKTRWTTADKLRANMDAARCKLLLLLGLIFVKYVSDTVAARRAELTLFGRVIGNERQAQTLDTLRDTPLPCLISGLQRLPENSSSEGRSS
jgi:hypothetical protein